MRRFILLAAAIVVVAIAFVMKTTFIAANELGEVDARAPLKRILDLKNWQFVHTFIAEMHFMRRQSI
jgi:hypothetical protein